MNNFHIYIYISKERGQFEFLVYYNKIRVIDIEKPNI